jgi:hypothetical protein
VKLITVISRRYYAAGTLVCARFRYALPRRSATGDGAEYDEWFRAQTGGIIQVTAKDPKNADQIATVQMHLKHIVGTFSDGDFPLLI